MEATDNAELNLETNGLNPISNQNTALIHVNHKKLNLSERIYY